MTDTENTDAMRAGYILSALNDLKARVSRRMHVPGANSMDDVTNVNMGHYIEETIAIAEGYMKSATFGQDIMTMDNDLLNKAYYHAEGFSHVVGKLEILLMFMRGPVQSDSELSPLFRQIAHQEYNTITRLAEQADQLWQDMKTANRRRHGELVAQQPQKSRVFLKLVPSNLPYTE